MVKKDNKINEYGYLVAVIGGAILIALILGFGILRPLYNSLTTTNKELKEKQAVLERLESNLENLKNLESTKEELIVKNEKVLSALPLDKDVPRLFVQLERIAAGVGLQVSSVSENGESASAPDTNEAAIVTPATYQVSGTATNYNALKQVLQKIETGLRIISVEKISVQGSGSDQSLSVSLIVKTYSRGQ